MKLLMFSTDTSAFIEGSQFTQRLLDYGALCEEIHVVVGSRLPRKVTSIGENITIWSVGRFFFPGAYTIGKQLLKKNSKSFRITAQEEFGGVVAYALSRSFQVPWQMQVHTDLASPYFWSHSATNKIRFLIARFLLPRASCVRAVGARVKEGLERMAPLKSAPSILPLYSSRDDVGERTYADPYFDFIILMVSRLTSEKNIPLALNAFARLVKKYPQTTLRIIGDGPLRTHLESHAEHLRLGAHVQFEGSKEGLSPYRKAAHAYLQTSWYEGYGLAVVEAMSAGLPIAMTNTGIAGELVINGESGLVVEPGDENALYEALRRVRSDAELREHLGQGARNAARGLSTKEEYVRAFAVSLETCSL